MRRALLILAWALLAALGGVVLARNELSTLREAFETDARISHRLLSQQAVQHEAVLATLSLLQPAPHGAGESQVEQRLSSVYPQIVDVLRHDAGGTWVKPGATPGVPLPEPVQTLLSKAEAASQASRRAVLASLGFQENPARYQLVLAGSPTSFAIAIDVRGAVPWAEWSMPVESSPVRVFLDHAGQRFVIQPGSEQAQTDASASGWRFEFRKHLASESQPFDVVAVRHVGWGELPWGLIALWAMLCAMVFAAGSALQRQRIARRRAEELLRFGQVARLNTLGELAAGMAHELSQPLTAVLANTQAARRLISGTPEELSNDWPSLQQAMDQAVAQAKRATDVLGRLRRTVEQPGQIGVTEAIDLEQTTRRILHLLEPECRKRQVVPRFVNRLAAQGTNAMLVQADPVALEQIIHNLLMNALQALDEVTESERSLQIEILMNETTEPGSTGSTGLATDQIGAGLLRIADSGPGFAPGALQRVFEPFFTTRTGGLGLGLSLCETLAVSMGGYLKASAGGLGAPDANTGLPRGARFELSLPLANSVASAADTTPSATTSTQPGEA